MIITIDCRLMDSSGIGVYIRECLPFFIASANSLFLLGESKKLKTFISNQKNIEILDCSIKPFSLTELFAFPRVLSNKINSGDIYFSPYFNIPGSIKIPVYTTIHDIIFPDMPELTSRLGLAVRMWFYRRAFRHSKKIFTVSEFSKSRIEYYSHGRIPVIVTHSAIQPWIIGKKTNEKKNTILFIGNIKKHKGLVVLIEAFHLAIKEGLRHKLVIVGSRENFRSSDIDIDNNFLASSDALPGTVEFTGFLPDEKLLELLGEASLLVQPSLYEGFCLPPLEAMISGTPALISDIPVLKEIYENYPARQAGKGFPVHWFKAGDANDLKEKLIYLLRDKNLKKIDLTPELENLYTFEKTSRTILENIKEK